MAFKSEYSKEELKEIIANKDRYSTELANSMGLILNSFEKHQVFPDKELVLANLSAGHLPFLFKNYDVSKEDVRNIKLLTIKAKNHKIYETQNNETIKSKRNLETFDIESVADLEEQTLEKIKDVENLDSQDLSVDGVAKTLISGLPAIFSPELHDLDFLNKLVQHKDFYDVTKRDYEFEEDALEDDVNLNTEAFVVNLINSLNIQQFNSLPIETLKKIDFFLNEQDYGDSFISKMLKTPEYLKKKYSFDDYFTLLSVKSAVLDAVEPEEAYQILEKAYKNEKEEKIQDFQSSRKKNKVFNPLISLYSNGDVWSTVRSIKALDRERINQIFENNYIPTLDESVSEGKLVLLRENLVSFSEYGVNFNMGNYSFLPDVIVPLIFNKEFSDKIYAHSKGRRDAFDLNSKEFESKIPEAIICVMRHQTPKDRNDSYPENFEEDLAALFRIVKNKGVYDDSQRAIYLYSIETMNSNPLMENFEFAGPIVKVWKKEGFFAYNEIKESFIAKFSEATADNVLIMNEAGFTEEAKSILQKLNPVDVDIVKNILMHTEDTNLALDDDIKGTIGAPISTSLNAPYKRMPKSPGYHCADLLMYSGDNFFEQIKKPEFKMSGDFAVSALASMNYKPSRDVNLFTLWMAENFKKYPEELPDLNDSNVNALFTKHKNLRGFIKVKDYSYDDIMKLNTEFLAIDQTSSEGKEKADKLKKEFSTIPEDVVTSFVHSYVQNKDWKKQEAPLLSVYRLKGCAFYNNVLDYPDLANDTDYIRSGFSVPVLNEEQANLFWLASRNEMKKDNAYSISMYEIAHLLDKEENRSVLFNSAIKDYPVFLLSKEFRLKFPEEMNNLGDDKLANLFDRAVRDVQIKELKPLFGGNSSSKSLDVGENFWEILASKKYSFKEKFILSEVLCDSCNINSMNKERLRERVQCVLDLNSFELNRSQEDLLKSDNFTVYSTFGCNLLFPELFTLKSFEKNKDDFKELCKSHHVSLYKFDFEVCAEVDGKAARGNQYTKIDFDIRNKVEVWKKTNKLGDAFAKDFSTGMSLFVENMKDDQYFREVHPKLSNYVLINDDNFSNFMELMSNGVNRSVERYIVPLICDSLKELVVSSIVAEDLSLENKLMLAELNQSMILSEKYFYGSEDNFNHYAKEVFLSPEVTSTLAAYTLREKIQTRFDTFKIDEIEEDEEISYNKGSGFKL